jgi:beta-lactamase class A
MIFKGEVASRGACDEIIGLMKRCQTGENRIWKYLPREKVEVAHKTGSVRGVVNDAGIIFPKDGDPYILCAFTKNLVGKGPESMTSRAIAESAATGEESIAKVSKIVYEYFTA